MMMTEQWKPYIGAVQDLEFDLEEASLMIADCGGISDFATIDTLKKHYKQKNNEQWKVGLFKKAEKARTYYNQLVQLAEKGVLQIEHRETHDDIDGRKIERTYINGTELQKFCCVVGYFPEILMPVDSSVVTDYLQFLHGRVNKLELENQELKTALFEETQYKDISDKFYNRELTIAMAVWQHFKNRRDDLSRSAREQIEDFLDDHYPNLVGRARDRVAGITNWQSGGGRPHAKRKRKK